MKISSQEEYGLRCLLQLARVPAGQLISVKDIAEKEGLSSAYVEKLLRLMSQADLVHSVRGIKGGYALNSTPDKIVLSRVMRALGGVQTTDDICGSFTGHESSCVHIENCGIRSVWTQLTAHIQDFLDNTSLASLLSDEGMVTKHRSFPTIIKIACDEEPVEEEGKA